MSSNSSIIDQFIAAWSRRDIDEIMAFFHPDAEYTNIPIEPPNHGTAALKDPNPATPAAMKVIKVFRSSSFQQSLAS